MASYSEYFFFLVIVLFFCHVGTDIALEHAPLARAGFLVFDLVFVSLRLILSRVFTVCHSCVHLRTRHPRASPLSYSFFSFRALTCRNSA